MDSVDSRPIEKGSPVPLEDWSQEPFEGGDVTGGLMMSEVFLRSISRRLSQMEHILEGIGTLFKYEHPGYASAKARLETFEGRKQVLPSSKDLAMGGFFYERRTDSCICFCCGLKLNKWKWGERPLEEHYRWHRYCPFLKSVYIK